mmetsp:Transcript_71261/g.196739  ORF Transcript_71261/g.196739 Transcript_71261/m.196739 type:complete len:237 (+) Transcript_71261:545-1255(+)
MPSSRLPTLIPPTRSSTIAARCERSSSGHAAATRATTHAVNGRPWRSTEPCTKRSPPCWTRSRASTAATRTASSVPGQSGMSAAARVRPWRAPGPEAAGSSSAPWATASAALTPRLSSAIALTPKIAPSAIGRTGPSAPRTAGTPSGTESAQCSCRPPSAGLPAPHTSRRRASASCRFARSSAFLGSAKGWASGSSPQRRRGCRGRATSRSRPSRGATWAALPLARTSRPQGRRPG